MEAKQAAGAITIDAESGAVEAGQFDPGRFGARGRRIPLKTLRDVRREMARQYRLHDQDQIESGEMNKRIWALGKIGEVITVAELEQRLIDLEQRALPA